MPDIAINAYLNAKLAKPRPPASRAARVTENTDSIEIHMSPCPIRSISAKSARRARLIQA